jgi:hypothetical protein
MQELTPREVYMAADPELYRDELRDSTSPRPVASHPALTAPYGTGPRPVSPEEADATLGPARHIMQELDLVIRTLPDTEQQTAVLMNLMVMAVERTMKAKGLSRKRGKVINAIADDFRARLQKYIPLDLSGD